MNGCSLQESRATSHSYKAEKNFESLSACQPDVGREEEQEEEWR